MIALWRLLQITHASDSVSGEIVMYARERDTITWYLSHSPMLGRRLRLRWATTATKSSKLPTTTSAMSSTPSSTTQPTGNKLSATFVPASPLPPGNASRCVPSFVHSCLYSKIGRQLTSSSLHDLSSSPNDDLTTSSPKSSSLVPTPENNILAQEILSWRMTSSMTHKTR